MRLRYRLSFALYVSLVLVSACSNGRVRVGPPTVAGAPTVTLAAVSELPAPTREDALQDGRAGFLGPLDKIVVDVYGIEELSQKELQVDAGGGISFPLVGALSVGGKSTVEVAALIREGLIREHVRDPRVSVNLRETVSQIVTVDGEVEEPGSYPVLGRMSLLRAIASAKGTTESSRQSEVLIFRTVGGKRLAGLYDLRAIRKGAYGDPEVYAGDVIVVGDSPARRLLRDAIGVVPVITTPLVLLLTR